MARKRQGHGRAGDAELRGRAVDALNGAWLPAFIGDH